MSSRSQTKPFAVVLTALPVEHAAVISHLKGVRKSTHLRGTVYRVGSFNVAPGTELRVAVAEIGPGNTGAAHEFERAAEHFKPEVVLFVGVAGGLKDVGIGDVVAGSKVYNLEWGKVANRFQVRQDVGECNYAIEQLARDIAKGRGWRKQIIGPRSTRKVPKAFVGPIASGEKVFSNTNHPLFRQLKANFSDALALEMEGCGFMKSARANAQVTAMDIRGISDLIDGKSAADKAGSQELAAAHASAFAFELLIKFYPTTKSSKAGKLTPSNSSALGKTPSVSPASRIGRVTSSGKWIMLGEEFFIAKEVRSSSENIEVDVITTDSRQEAALCALESSYKPWQSIPFAHGNTGCDVSIERVTSVSTGDKMFWTVFLRLKKRQNSNSFPPMNFSTGSQTWTSNDIARMRAERILLGVEDSKEEKGGRQYSTFNSFVSVTGQYGDSFLPSIIQPWPSKDVKNHLQKARLGVVYALQADNLVEHIEQLSLGPVIARKLKVKLVGTYSPQQGNRHSTRIEVEGAIPLSS